MDLNKATKVAITHFSIKYFITIWLFVELVKWLLG